MNPHTQFLWCRYRVLHEARLSGSALLQRQNQWCRAHLHTPFLLRDTENFLKHFYLLSCHCPFLHLLFSPSLCPRSPTILCPSVPTNTLLSHLFCYLYCLSLPKLPFSPCGPLFGFQAPAQSYSRIHPHIESSGPHMRKSM